MLSRILSPNRVFKTRPLVKQLLRVGSKPVSVNGIRSLSTLQYSYPIQVKLDSYSHFHRSFTSYTEDNQTSFQEKAEAASSFESAVNLISVYSIWMIITRIVSNAISKKTYLY